MDKTEEEVALQREADTREVEQILYDICLLFNRIEALKGDRKDELGRLLAVTRTLLQPVRAFVYTDIYLIEMNKLSLFIEVK